ncbi:hypothetical protein IscW_ISCW007112 [Ixodes scapularis]|uniref:Uncharacterized protein n=1 Tax=Ixodes scapularis TaxID=6945 RepID=B7PTR0_IXOSC|nr:hypothetical protein IscW_ISCW007112 [Ixodes scapularis]|eukprot:XP_002404782.1 hypothetical protein IscW_ISCW007112 [Ixodes scapularis]
MSAHSAGSLGYLSKVSTLGPAYRVSVEDRMRWQHIADAMGNIYVQPEATAPPKTPPVFASPPRVRSPSPPEESHYSHIQRPRSRGAMYGPPPNHTSYEYEPPKRDAYTPVMPYYKTATLRTMYS